MYAIVATIIHHTTDNHGLSVDITIPLPTFYLDENVQGIVSEEHAMEIARQIICPVDLQYEGLTVNGMATKVERKET